MKKPNPFGPRRYRPWSYEFQGARTWPAGTGESEGGRTSEEYQPTRPLYPSEITTEDCRQWIAKSNNRLYLRVVDTKRPFWRPNGKPWSSSFQTPFPTYAAELPALPPLQSTNTGEQEQQGTEYMYTNGPQIQQRPRSAMGSSEMGWPKWAEGCTPGELSYRIGCIDHPGCGSRGRTYMNFANDHWIA